VLVADAANLAIGQPGVHSATQLLGRGPLLMFEMRTDSRDAPLTSLLATRPHHSNLYSRFERFGRFLRGSDAPVESSPEAWLIACGWLCL